MTAQDRRDGLEGAPVQDATGRVVRWYGTCTDIEEMKQTKDELRQERLMLKTMIDSIPDLIFIVNPAGELTQCNKAMLDYCNAKQLSDIAGKHPFDGRRRHGWHNLRRRRCA